MLLGGCKRHYVMCQTINMITIMTSLCVAIVTAWVAVFLAFRRYKFEKWWDRKAQCYIETIEALNKMMEVCDINIGDTASEPVATNANELSEKYRKGKSFLITQTNIGRLFLSDEAYKVLLQFDNELSRIEEENEGPRKIADIRVSVENCIEALIPIARRDIGGNPFF